MRKKIVVANWKMNNTQDEAIHLVTAIISKINNLTLKEVEVVIAPSYLYIKDVIELTKGNLNITVAAQNCSENENNLLLKQKIDLILSNHLLPIYCCGESLEERNSDEHFSVVENQLNEALFHLPMELMKKLVIAYEPVWAIGTGVTATVNQTQEMHQFIRNVISKKYNSSIADSISVLYGGSCNSTNASELFACEDVDGGLVGGVSLAANDFVKIVESFID